MPKEKLSQPIEYRPPSWIMDVLVASLFEADPKSKVAIQISMLILEYDKKCAKAKIELYDAVQKLMK